MHSVLCVLYASLFPLLASCWSFGASDDDKVFEYRDIHLPENLTDEGRKLNLNNVSSDWGLWGHNLAVVLDKKAPERVFALVDGYRDSDQFCFSSEELLRMVERYVVDNYGERGGTRFAILPNDNSLVCQCATCKRLGNTERNASPAVIYMIRRLCERFPGHLFFTSHYATTRSLPAQALPDNAGVLVSAMDYPLNAGGGSSEQKFMKLLSSWSQKTRHVYVWDYINNFDDYLTPFPVLTIMQRRLRLYAEAGVRGVFLNGSAPDYSAFSAIKLHVLAGLLNDPQQDWAALLDECCEATYSVAGKAIARFMRTQELWMAQQQKNLPLYGGMTEALATYLPADELVRFHDELIQLQPQTLRSERRTVTQLCNSLAFTRLELMRLNGQIAEAEPMLKRLSECVLGNIKVYNESCWTVQSYIDDYRYMLNHAQKVGDTNLLRGATLRALSALDEDYSDLSILTDGQLGLPSNYHCGQLISSEGNSLSLAVPCPKGMQKLCIHLTSNVLFHYDFPKELVLVVGGREVSRAKPRPQANNPHRAVVEFAVPASAGECTVRLLRDADAPQGFAIDEVEGF